MVGEIRDPETAKIAVQHLSPAHSPIHPAQPIHRPGFLFVWQIWGRAVSGGGYRERCSGPATPSKLCENCREECEPDKDILRLFSERGFNIEVEKDHFSSGCEECGETGVSGRVMVYEFMEMRREIHDMVVQGMGKQEIRDEAVRLGMHPLEEKAIAYAQQGVISLGSAVRLLAV